MKTDRIFALVAAGLITLLLATVFAHEKVGAPQDRTHGGAPAYAATGTHPSSA